MAFLRLTVHERQYSITSFFFRIICNIVNFLIFIPIYGLKGGNTNAESDGEVFFHLLIHFLKGENDMTKKRIVSLFLAVFMAFTCTSSVFAYSHTDDVGTYFVCVPNKESPEGLFRRCIGFSGSINTPRDGKVLYISPYSVIYGTISKEVPDWNGLSYQYDHTIDFFDDCTITRTAGTGTVKVEKYSWNFNTATCYCLVFNASPGDKFHLVNPYSGAECYFIVQ